MDIVDIHRAHPTTDSGYSQRLFPWPAVRAPFEAAWSVFDPGQASAGHEHHEYELFIAMHGKAILHCGGEQRTLAAGEIAYLPPHTHHQVVNEFDERFEMFSVWWDQLLSEQFVADRPGDMERAES